MPLSARKHPELIGSSWLTSCGNRHNARPRASSTAAEPTRWVTTCRRCSTPQEPYGASASIACHSRKVLCRGRVNMMRRTLRLSYPLLDLLGRQDVVQLRGAVDLEVALLPCGPAQGHFTATVTSQAQPRKPCLCSCSPPNNCSADAQCTCAGTAGIIPATPPTCVMFVLPATTRQQTDKQHYGSQLIGNSVKSWESYYDLNRVLREGQTALEDMAVWRHFCVTYSSPNSTL